MSTTAVTLEKLNKTKIKKNSWEFFWEKSVNKVLLMKITAAVLILAVLGVGSWRVAKAYEGKILPKVTVAGIKVGGKTPSQAKALVQKYVDELNAKGPEITYGNETVSPRLADIGAGFDVDKVISNAYNYGRQGSFKDKISQNAQMVLRGKNVTLAPQIDEPKLDAYLSQMAQVVEVAPENAALRVSGAAVELTPAKIGRGLDKDKLKSDLTNLINTNKLESKIVLVTSDLSPKIKEEGTVSARAQAERFIKAAPINVTHEDQVYSADRAEIGSWITFNEAGDHLTADISAGKVADFTGAIALKIEIPKIDREVMDGTGEVLNEGQDGRGVDAGRLTNEIRTRALAGTPGAAIAVATYPIPKGEIVKNPHAQPGRYAGRYIDINLSEQTLYAFEDSKLVNQFLISSGKSGYATPTGEYSVWGKTRAQTMDGPGYFLPNVEWISWFNGEISIHGTYWHNNFGTPMSHGCINASIENAEWIYNWDEVGTPVYVHE